MPLYYLFRLCGCLPRRENDDDDVGSKRKKTRGLPTALTKDQSLRMLAKSENFDRICNILLRTNPDDVKMWLEDDCSKRSSNFFMRRFLWCRKDHSGNALHFLIFHRPPAKTIDMLYKWVAANEPGIKLDEMRDSEGRTPLHIAVQCGCDMEVIERLLKDVFAVAPSLSVKLLDNMKRTPLHWACTRKELFQNGGNHTGRACQNENEIDNTSDYDYALIRALVNAFPEALRMEDVHQMTPCHLACKNRLDQRILVFLMKAYLELFGKKDAMLTEGTHVRLQDKHSTNGGVSELFASPRRDTTQMSLVLFHKSCAKLDHERGSSVTEDITEASDEKFLIDSIPLQISCRDDGESFMSECSVVTDASKSRPQQVFIGSTIDLGSVVSSIGDCGVTTYRPEAVVHEHRDFVSW